MSKGFRQVNGAHAEAVCREAEGESGMTRFSGGMLGVVAATAALAAMGDAQAQTRSDEIVVTANRRETALQQVPIAVTPVTAELIQPTCEHSLRRSEKRKRLQRLRLSS